MNMKIIKEAMQSAEAKTKGLVLDLEFYSIPDEREMARKKAAEEELAKLEAEEAAAEGEGEAEGDGEGEENKAEEEGAEAAPTEAQSEQKEGGSMEDEDVELDEDYGAHVEKLDNWMKIIRMKKFLGEDLDIGVQQEFSHIIEIDLEDDEIHHRAKGIRLDNVAEMPPENPDDEEKKLPFQE
jgi:hypothetical protein